MFVRVRLFAILRERAGADSVELELADGATVSDALAALSRLPAFEGLIGRLPMRLAVNRDYADADSPLDEGDELALIPPVSGGDGDAVHAAVREEPLDPAAIAARVIRPGAGALVSFQGMTRQVERLDYEAYAEMARERIETILVEVLAAHQLEAVAAEHRIGPVALSEPSVVVAASSAHREAAFAGARQAIDRIKAEAPIWKREIDGGKARWVEGTTPA